MTKKASSTPPPATVDAPQSAWLWIAATIGQDSLTVHGGYELLLFKKPHDFRGCTAAAGEFINAIIFLFPPAGVSPRLFYVPTRGMLGSRWVAAGEAGAAALLISSPWFIQARGRSGLAWSEVPYLRDAAGLRVKPS